MTDPDSLFNDFPLEPLTWREKEILSLLAERQSDREIAQTLSISLETVKWYNKRLYAKLGVNSRRKAAARAKALGLLVGEGGKEPAAFSHNLPAQTTPFVGRQRELEDLSNLLTQTDVRLVTILAAGGMGKTRLALKSAEGQSAHFIDGVFFVPLTVLGSDGHIASTIAESVGLRLQAGGNPKQQLFQYLRNKQILLLLDNLEHALRGAGLVGEMLHTAPEIKILATSRERLNLSGETIYPLEGMALPGDILGGVLDEHDAVGLFIQSAQHVHPVFEAQAGDWEPIVHICRLVDGMPLGIVLAAAWVRILSPGEIANEITRDLDFLSTNMRDVPQRQRSIRAVFASTWRRLSDVARTTFEKLSVCEGGFTLEAAQKIASANLPTLQLLADRGMLWRTQANRYEVHGLLRQFAEERLQQGEGFRGAFDAHSLYYSELLFNLETELRSRRQAAALSRIEDDIENVQAAWRYALERGNDATVAMMLPSLYYFYETRGWFEEGEAAFRRAARRFAPETRMDEQSLLLGRLLARQGAFAHRLGHYQQAGQVLQASLSILRRASARAELAFTLSFMADLARSLGKYAVSRQLCQQSLALFREVDDKWGIAGELHNLGVAAYHLGDFGDARDYYDESLARSRELNDPYGIVTSLIGIGVLAHDLGDYQGAEQLYAESLGISEALGDRYGVAASLINLGRVYYLTGDLEKGKQRCQTGLEISRDLGDLWGTAASLINLGDIACKMEKFQESRAHFREALQFVTELQSEPLEIEILIGMATLLAETGNEDSALELLAPILHHPLDDKEIRERAIHLRDRLEKSLSQETVIEIQARSRDKSIESTVRQLFHLV